MQNIHFANAKFFKKLLQKMSLKLGVNKDSFDHLKREGLNMSEENKVCSLVWDEASIDAQIYYNEK